MVWPRTERSIRCLSLWSPFHFFSLWCSEMRDTDWWSLCSPSGWLSKRNNCRTNGAHKKCGRSSSEEDTLFSSWVSSRSTRDWSTTTCSPNHWTSSVHRGESNSSQSTSPTEEWMNHFHLKWRNVESIRFSDLGTQSYAVQWNENLSEDVFGQSLRSRSRSRQLTLCSLINSIVHWDDP